MSVEQSCAPGAPKSASGGQIGYVKGKSPATGGGGQADKGDFASLLMTLGSDEAGDSGVGQDALIQPLVRDEVLLDPGLILAQSMQLQPVLPKTTGTPGNGVLTTSQATIKSVKPGPQRGGDALQVVPDAARPAAALPVTEQDLDKLAISADAAKGEKKELPQATRDAPGSHTANDVSRSVTSRLAAEEHANKLVHADNRVAQSPALSQMVQATGMGDSGARQTERVTERSAFKQVGGSDGSVWGYQALVEAGRIDPPAPTTGASVLSPERTVAEQVNYWLGRDVQNAELKLDGLGDSPVKVSISLQGNEAHIEFRTDQAQARQVLEGAVSHLKDLLGSEGLVLSSVSVGSSRSGGDDPREKKTPQHSRQVALTVPAARVGEAAQRPVRLSGRTVDLFV